MAALPYPVPVNSSGLSVTLWVQFAEKYGVGVILSLYTIPSPSNLLNKELLVQLNESMLMYQDPTSRDTHYAPMPNPDHGINNGEWHYVVITMDLDKGELFTITDSIRSDGVTIFNGYLNANVWIVLGNSYDEDADGSHQRSFRGKISHVTVYDRVLDFSSEVAAIGYREVSALFGDSIVRWGLEFVLTGGVQRLTPSRADNSCPFNYTGDADCTQLLPGKNLVTVVSCPEDIIQHSVNRWIEISYPEPTFLGAGNLFYSFSTVDVYTWGRYPVTVAASNDDGNSAICLFNIYVQNKQCERPNTPSNVKELLCKPVEDEDYEDYRECSITCIDGYSPSIPGPYLHTCDPTGNWDSQNMFDTYVLSPCGGATDAEMNLVVTIVYNVIPEEDKCDFIKEALKEKILETQNDLNSQWNTICGQPDCSDTIITVICPVLTSATRRRRQAELTPVKVTLTQPNINLTVSNPAFNNSVNIEALYNDLLFSDIENAFDYSGNVAGATPDRLDEKTSVMLQLVCDAPNVLIGEMCVACGPGTYYNSTVMACHFCEPGSYQDKEGQYNCTLCVPSLTTQSYGAYTGSDCKDTQECPPGQEIADNSDCTACTIGFYSGVDDLICIRCPEGTVTVFNESTSQEDCNVADNSPGTYRNASNPLQAVDCPIGQYQPLKWQYECLECDGELTTETTGSNQKSDCKSTADLSTSKPVDTDRESGSEESLSIYAVVFGSLAALLAAVLIITIICFVQKNRELKKKGQSGNPGTADGSSTRGDVNLSPLVSSSPSSIEDPYSEGSIYATLPDSEVSPSYPEMISGSSDYLTPLESHPSAGSYVSIVTVNRPSQSWRPESGNGTYLIPHSQTSGSIPASYSDSSGYATAIDSIFGENLSDSSVVSRGRPGIEAQHFENFSHREQYDSASHLDTEPPGLYSRLRAPPTSEYVDVDRLARTTENDYNNITQTEVYIK